MPELMETHEYDKMYAVEEQLWWYQSLRQILLSQLRKYYPTARFILDAGCGTGMNSLFLRSHGYQLTSFDLSAQAVTYSKKRGLKAEVANITKLPTHANSQDVVLLMDVMGSLSDSEQKAALKEFHRVLKDGGLLIIHAAALQWLYSTHDVASHIRKRFSSHELSELFDQKIWTVERCSYRISLLFPLIASIKVLKKLTYQRTRVPSGDLDLPHPLVNAILRAIQAVEDFFFQWIDFPIGTSVFLIARKKTLKESE